MPPFNLPQIGAAFAPRALRTPLIEALENRPERVDPAAVGPQLVEVIRAGGGQDELPFTGQSVELVHDIVPAGQLVHRLWQECQAALALALTHRDSGQSPTQNPRPPNQSP
jgi:enoyl-[acyl-carrier protein] reductase II